MTLQLQGKTAVVTGGADGIGRGIAEGFARAGARVFVGDIDAGKGAELAKGSEGAIHFAACDVSHAADVERLIEGAVAASGRLDVLVNNAGVAIGPKPIHEMSPEDLQRQLAVNQLSMLLACKYAMPHLVKSQGNIINLGSMQAHVGVVGWTAYAGTKAAAIAMAQQLAVEFGPAGVRANSISPGAIRTEMNEKIAQELGEHIRAVWNSMHPLGRVGEVDEVTQAAVFLASDAASFITGVDLKVDGGATLQPRDIAQPAEKP